MDNIPTLQGGHEQEQQSKPQEGEVPSHLHNDIRLLCKHLQIITF